MKKSIIWLLTIVMSLTFGTLLYFQISYLENMVRMRESQFSETVMRCLSSTSVFLEKNETFHFLQEDINMLESGLYDEYSLWSDEISLSPGREKIIASEQQNNGQNQKFGITYFVTDNNPNFGLSNRYNSLQEMIRSQYLYQKGLLNEVIFSILKDAGKRAASERADSTLIKNHLANELDANGLNLPFVFSVTGEKDNLIYSTPGYDQERTDGVYSQVLFPNTDSQLKLKVYFPTKTNYIYSSVRFIIPTLSFTLILLIVFLFTIIMAFRQKKLSEMKRDFINNMTHELKTPISTISLAAQMLNDDSVMKSPASLKRLSQVIGDESKRLRFQVEKVLQMSVFDNSSTSLKFADVNANNIIENVVHTFRIKVEKFGGAISCNLNAPKSVINVDEMHFTNIIYNLLDNAVKYMGEDTEPRLNISTEDVDDDKMLEIRVKDNGIGIKKEDLKKIFEKFYRVSTKNRHDVKGFGLGLAYVKKMVTLFHGSIHVESEIGKGSTFIIRLPLAP